MAESNITEEEMRNYGRVPEPTDAPLVQRQETSPGQERTRALNETLEYYTPPELRSRVEAFNEYLNPVTGFVEAGEDSKRAFDSGLPVAERLKAAGSSLLNTGMSAIPIGLAAKKFLTPAQAVVDTLAGFGNTSPDVPTGITDDLMKTAGDVTTTPREAPSRSLFREGDTRNVADFYSPARELLDYTQYPSKGLKGSEAIKLLKNAPDVRQSEIDLLEINPQTRYNREELLDLVNNNTYTVTAERPTELDWQGNYQHYETQRQELKPSVEELDYQETILRAQRPSTSFKAAEGTHHTGDTIAHLRTSRQQNMDTGDRFYLVEEIQSDLVSRGSSPVRGPISYDEAISENADKAFNQLKSDQGFKPVIEDNREFLEDYYKNMVGKEPHFPDNRSRFSTDPVKSFVEKYNIQNDMESAGNYLIDKGVRPTVAFALMNHMRNDAQRLSLKSPESLTEAVGGAPIKDINEVVRLGLQTAISDALANGDTKVVIPNLDRIVSAGRARPGTKDYENMTAPGSSFHRMYVTGLQKAISELQKDLPELTVGSMDVPYNRYPDLPSAATVLDLSAYSDKNLNTLRFAEGGLATERQMNRLMADGGLSDDGMSMDPVSGNEVPPGSMVEEVRDDIPAQLSGGEYVVPADVVRYYGVRFFEDLRGEAKGGLNQMEQEGRIGGEPMPQDVAGGAGGASLSEEDMAMLQAIASQQGGAVGMAEGGMAQQNTMMGGDQLIDNIINVAKSDPTLMSKLNSKGVMLAEGGLLTGYAEGGFTPSFDPSDWTTVGGSYFDNTGQTGSIENRTYRGPNGETITVRFQNGVAMDPIPQGYILSSEYNAPAGLGGGLGGTGDYTAPSRNDSDSTTRDTIGSPSAPTVRSEPDDPSKYRGVDFNDPFGAAQEAIAASQGNFTGRLASAVAGSINPALGAAVKQGIVMNGLANARANLEVARRQGDDEAVAKIEALLAEREKSLGVARGAISDLIASGEGIANNAWDQFTSYGLTSAPTTPQEAISSVSGGGSGGGSGREVTTSTGVTYRTDSSDDDDGNYGVRVATGSTAPTSSPRPVARPSTPSSSSSSSSGSSSSYVDKSPVSSGSGTTSSSAYKSDGKVSTSGRATGGLMGKPKKL